LKSKNTCAARNNKNVKYRNGYYLNDELVYKKMHGWVYGYSGGDRSKEVLLRDIYGNIIKTDGRKNSLSIPTKYTSFIRHNNGWQYTLRINLLYGGDEL
jgi:hypothetical protein